MSGVALIISAVMVVITFFVIQRKQVIDARRRDFQTQYDQFWSEKVMAEVRNWIIVDEAYQQIESILRMRNASDSCILTEQEYQALEKIDQFCSVIVRLRSFGETLIKDFQRQPWRRAMLAEYWIERISKREAMREYVAKSWPQFFEPLIRLPPPPYATINLGRGGSDSSLS